MLRVILITGIIRTVITGRNSLEGAPYAAGQSGAPPQSEFMSVHEETNCVEIDSYVPSWPTGP